MTNMTPPKKITTVYYDGSCPMCTAFVGGVEKSTAEEFSYEDITVTTLPAQLSSEAVQREMHVIDSSGVIYKNAEAILVILDGVPYWRRVTWIGRLPLVRRVLPIGYNLIARNRHFLFGPASRVWWLKITVLTGLVASLLLSLPLWLQSKTIPSVPVMSELPELPAAIEATFFTLALFLIVAALFSSRPQKYILGAVGVFLILIFFDQLRFQPWLYQYLAMMCVLGLYSWNWRDVSGRTAVLHTLRILVAGIYLYSGLQKVTVPFFESVFPWMVEPIAVLLPHSLYLVPASFGVLVPFIEILMGVGLLVRSLRRWALIGVVCMLVFVLFTLGPLGHNWNSVVWPWNIAIAAAAFLLFYRTDNVSTESIFSVTNFWPHRVVILLFLIMPAFSFFGWWDSYPSYSLYSGNTTEGYIRVSPVDLSPVLSRVAQPVAPDTVQINLQTLSFAERNVPMYPETRVFTQVFLKLCETELPAAAELVVTTKATLLQDRKELRYGCENVLRP
jgi:predicted DCC family thiol-disulfide oxidoreductase YuxK